MKRVYHAFTLVEVIVVIAIIGILSAVIIVSISQERNRNEVEAEAREFAARFRQLQNDALTGKYIGNDVACSYVMEVASNSYTMSYMLSPSCASVTACSSTGVTRSPVGTFPIKNGVSVSGPNGACFSIPFGKAYNRGGGNFSPQTYTFSKATGGTTLTYSVCVGSRGDITVVGGSSCS